MVRTFAPQINRVSSPFISHVGVANETCWERWSTMGRISMICATMEAVHFTMHVCFPIWVRTFMSSINAAVLRFIWQHYVRLRIIPALMDHMFDRTRREERTRVESELTRSRTCNRPLSRSSATRESESLAAVHRRFAHQDALASPAAMHCHQMSTASYSSTLPLTKTNMPDVPRHLGHRDLQLVRTHLRLHSRPLEPTCYRWNPSASPAVSTHRREPTSSLDLSLSKHVPSRLIDRASFDVGGSLLCP